MTYSKKSIPESWVAELHAKLHRRYGRQWLKNVGDTDEERIKVIQEWQQVLGNTTGEQIRHGLESWDSQFPPNVYQFRTSCRSATQKGAHKPYKAISGPIPSKELAREEIASLKMYMSLAEPAPPRSDKDAYMEWSNKHRRVINMPPIKQVNDDGTLICVGDS